MDGEMGFHLLSAREVKEKRHRNMTPKRGQHLNGLVLRVLASNEAGRGRDSKKRKQQTKAPAEARDSEWCGPPHSKIHR